MIVYIVIIIFIILQSILYSLLLRKTFITIVNSWCFTSFSPGTFIITFFIADSYPLLVDSFKFLSRQNLLNNLFSNIYLFLFAKRFKISSSLILSTLLNKLSILDNLLFILSIASSFCLTSVCNCVFFSFSTSNSVLTFSIS